MNVAVKPGIYYFSATNGWDKQGRNVEEPQEPQKCEVISDTMVKWKDGMITLVLTVCSRLGETPEDAIRNTARCIARQDYA
jgi:hypothetical protein